MQYTLFTNKFGGYNTYLDPVQVGPQGSVNSLRTDVTQGPLKPRLGNTVLNSATDALLIPGESKTVVPFSNRAVGMLERLSTATWGQRIYRAHKGLRPWADSDINCIQYTTNTEPESLTAEPTWDCLGMAPPPAKPTVALASTGSLAIDTYKYRVTFYNALGQESPPSPESDPITTTAGNQKIDLSNLPLFYSSIITSNNDKDAFVSDFTYNKYLRVGMRIVGPKITNGTVVVSATQSGPTRAVRLSADATGTGTDSFRDSQIIGRRIYRYSERSATYQLVHQIPNMTDTTWSDSGTTDAGRTLDTLASSEIPAFCRDVSINPGGIITFVLPDGNIAYFNLGGTTLYRSDRAVFPPDSPLTSTYALGRFIFPSKRGAFSVSIEDVTGIPIVSMIDADEASEGSPNVYCVDTGGEVWWNTSKGIMGTDGLSIKPITRYTHSLERNKAMKDAFGALNFNGEILFYTRRNLQFNDGVIYIFNPKSGWSEGEVLLKNNLNDNGTLGAHLGNGFSVYTPGPGDGVQYAYSIASEATRVSSATYRTGEWAGERESQLKKFRKVSLLYKQLSSSGANPRVFVYIDGKSTPVIQVAIPNAAEKTRYSFWLPPETKGRTISFFISMAATTEIDEIGVWVGEQRKPMP